MKRTVTLVARLMLPFAVMAAPASAQEDVDCNDPQNTVEMRFCASQDFEEADRALNAAYRELTQRLDVEPLAILKKSQRSWVSFRDAECEFQAYWTKGGTISPQLETQCKTILTELRVKQLGAYLKCEEGDLACPQDQ